MRWLMVCFLGLALASSAEAAEGRILKVLPQFLDTNGLSSLTPSLYDRDAYQASLRLHPEKRSGLRFAIQWKAGVPESEPLKLRVQIVGMAKSDLPQQTSFEQTVRQHHWFSHWAYLSLSESEYKTFGEVTAWRVTLWDGDQLLGEQKSFLWQDLPPAKDSAPH
jgi:hypothetical protein